jgi:hypothetical protein
VRTLEDDEAVATGILAAGEDREATAGADREFASEMWDLVDDAAVVAGVGDEQDGAPRAPRSRCLVRSRRSTAWTSSSRVSASMIAPKSFVSATPSALRRSPGIGIGTSVRHRINA